MKKVAELNNKMSYPAGFAFSSDGKTFISGNYDGIIRVYDFLQHVVKWSWADMPTLFITWIFLLMKNHWLYKVARVITAMAQYNCSI